MATFSDSKIPIRASADNEPLSSESEFDIESNVDEQSDNAIQANLEQHLTYLNEKMAHWTLRRLDSISLIQKPTASQLEYRFLHPAVYQMIGTITSLNELAQLLDSDADWEAKYDTFIGYNLVIMNYFNRFKSLSEDTPESIIQAHFIGLVSMIGAFLEIAVDPKNGQKVIVGGILAEHSLDFRSATDPSFAKNDRFVLASEVKTAKVFKSDTHWYLKSHGIQILSALYAFNCPTMLLTQKIWKLFVENQERTQVFTLNFNGDIHHLSRASHNMDETFLIVITICLLSRRSGTSLNKGPSVPVMDDSTSTSESAPSKKTPAKKARRDIQSPTMNQPEPRFISGFDNGQPMYTVIRVRPQDEVDMIENAIAEEEKLQRLSRTESDATIVARYE